MIDDSAVNYIVETGFEPEMGARPIKRTIDKYIVDPLAQNLLSSIINKDGQITISYFGNSLRFRN
jgi:ATP-dependent Clp protease ATP-binding subunit ClpA